MRSLFVTPRLIIHGSIALARLNLHFVTFLAKSLKEHDFGLDFHVNVMSFIVEPSWLVALTVSGV